MSTGAVFKLLGGSTGRSLEEQIALFAEVSADFASSLDIEETLKVALHRLMTYLEAEAASVFLLENDGETLVCHKCAGPVNIAGLRIDAETGIVGKSIRDRECQIVRDVSLDPDFAQSVDADTGFVTRSILCAPLMVGANTIGAIELMNKRSSDGLFDEHDQHLLTGLAAAASLGINNARMAESLVEKERLEKELELAREIQRNLLPVSPDASFPIFGINVPAWEVSGDFYDFVQLADGRIYFNLADVSGKGMNAALLMAKTSSLLHCLAKTAVDMGSLLEAVNEEVCETASHGMFVTIVSGFIDPRTERVTLANAGHQPALVHRANGEFEEYAALSPPLGIISGAKFPTVEFGLEGGSLYLFSDGVTESLTEHNRQLDLGGLMDLILEKSKMASSVRLQDIVAQVRRGEVRQRDDITLMLIERDRGLEARGE
ncbi:MAG: sigma-B regulation protein RsbU (phosphoserine phosphatase) [Gammaproteobacteria bacterium]|jgi:sigma-B regulation protein RsbU (phosphoserine phosphatase)